MSKRSTAPRHTPPGPELGSPAAAEVTQPAAKPTGMPAKKQMVRSAMSIAAGTLTSRILGFFRGALLIAVLGTVGVQDAYQVASTLPGLLYGLLAGSIISAVLLPEMVKAFAREDGGEDYVNRLLTFTFVTLGAGTLILTLGSHLVVSLIAPYLSPGVKALAVMWSHWFMPQLFFYGMQTVLGQALNAKEHYWEAAWSPVLNNLISLAGLSYYIYMFGFASAGYVDPLQFSTAQMLAIAIPNTLGIAVQGLSLIWPLKKAGYSWKFTWGFRGYGLGRPFRVATWTLLSATTYMLSNLVVQVLASAAENYGQANQLIVPGPAANANATLIYMLPHAVFTASIATPLYTRISSLAASGKHAEIRSQLNRYMHRISQITVFFSTCLVVFAVPILQCYAPSRSAVEINSYASVLVGYGPILVFMALFVMLLQVLLAFAKANIAFRGYVVKAIVMIGGSLAATQFFNPSTWVISSAVAATFSYLAADLVLYYYCDRMLPGTTPSSVTRNLLGTLIAAVPAGLAGSLFLFFTGQYAHGSSGHVMLVSVAKCGVGGFLVLGIFLAGLWLLGERDIFAEGGNLIRKFLPGKK